MTNAPAGADDRGIAESPRPWVLAMLVLTGVALVLSFALLPHAVTGDGYIRFLKIDALLRTGTLNRERYSLIGPLAAAPLWYLGDSRVWWFARFNVLALAAGVAAAWFALRSAMTPAERAAAILLLAATGMMPNATLDFYGEMFSAVTVGTGLLIVFACGRRLGWIPVVLGVANMPASTIGLLVVALHRIWKTRRLDGLVTFALAVALILLENVLVRGAPFNAGYSGDHGATTMLPFSGMPGFSYPLLLGVVSLLFSFGKGLLFFAPGLLLVARARRDCPRLGPFFDASLVFLAGLVLVYAKWWAWYGGWKWGPRFLLFAAYPSSLALAVALGRGGRGRGAAIAVALTAWTAWVGVSGAVFDLAGLDECIANGYALEHLCWYVPDYSPLLRPFVMPPDTLLRWQQIWMLFAAVAFAILITFGPWVDRLSNAPPRDTLDRL